MEGKIIAWHNGQSFRFNEVVPEVRTTRKNRVNQSMV
jgi:hypothetical protein